MRTQIIIRHATGEALTSHPLWAQIMELFMVEGPVSVEEMSAEDEAIRAAIEIERERCAKIVDDKDALIAGLRKRMLSIFYWMDEIGSVFHPLVVEDVWRMAELLDIDTASIPTESRDLARPDKQK